MILKTRLRPASHLIDLTPLVDVIFLLLVFFIITSDILPLKSLNIKNPVVEIDSAPLTTQILIVMDAEEVLYLGSHKTIVGMDSLKELLKKEVLKIEQRKGDPSIVLNVDRRVDYGTFLQLFALVQQCCQNIRLVYETPSF